MFRVNDNNARTIDRHFYDSPEKPEAFEREKNYANAIEPFKVRTGQVHVEQEI